VSTLVSVSIIVAWVFGCLGFVSAGLFKAAADSDREDDEIYNAIKQEEERVTRPTVTIPAKAAVIETVHWDSANGTRVKWVIRAADGLILFTSPNKKSARRFLHEYKTALASMEEEANNDNVIEKVS
jgi:hypothetical protein